MKRFVEKLERFGHRAADLLARRGVRRRGRLQRRQHRVERLETRTLLTIGPLDASLGSTQQPAGDWTGWFGSDALPVPDEARAEMTALGDARMRAFAPSGQRPLGATMEDGSEYMLGDVWVTVVLMESDGSIDRGTEDWTQEEIDQVKQEIQEGAAWWETTLQSVMPVQSLHNLAFQFDFTYADTPVNTGYEPINRTSWDQGLWINNFLDAAGHNTPRMYFTDLMQWNDDQRLAHQTDWAYTVFVADSSNDADGAFLDGKFAYAYLGGPFAVMTYDNGGSGIDMMGQVYAHETAHVFYALDESPGSHTYTDRSGYYNTQNLNARDGHPDPASRVPSITAEEPLQSTAWANHTSSPTSLEMIGWKDSDRDGIFDVLDDFVPPGAPIGSLPASPLVLTGTGQYNPSTGQYQFTGAGTVRALANLNPNPNSLHHDITLNTIDVVQHQFDNGPWIDGTAFGTYSANISETVAVPPGPTTISFRTLYRQTGLTSNVYTASLSPAALTLNIVASAVSEGAGAAATTAVVTRAGGDITVPLTVTLTSSDTTEIAVPATVIIPANQAQSLPFNVSAVDDLLVDGVQTVTVIAAAAGYAPGSDSIQVTDDESGAGQIRGSKFNDLNGDGIWDTTEPALPGWTIFLDDNRSGRVDRYTANLASTDVPKPIPDVSLITSTLAVAGVQRPIVDVDVKLNITHAWDSDLAAVLISPLGTRVRLFNGVGGSGQNFTNTTLDDEGPASIKSGSAPFTGRYRATDLLSALDGQSANGAWTLEITDGAAGDVGTLNNWSLVLTTGERSTLTDANGNYAFTGLADGAYTVAEELQAGWEQTSPGGTRDLYYVYDSTADRLYTIDPAGAVNALGPAGGDLPVSGLALDPDQYILYGSSNTGQLWTFDLVTGAATLLGTLPTSIQYEYGLAYYKPQVGQGRLYTVNGEGDLVQIDPTTLSATVVNPNGPGYGGGGIAFNPRDARIYVHSNGSPRVYSYSVTDFSGPAIHADPPSKPHYGMADNGATLVLGPGASTTGATLFSYDPGTGASVPLFRPGILDGRGFGGLEFIPGNAAGPRTVTVAGGVGPTNVNFGNRLKTTGDIRGVKWNDVDGDGVRDPGEAGLEGWTVYLDQNRNGVMDLGHVNAASTDPAQPIPDLSTVTSTITASGANGPIADVNVTLDIAHTWDADLSVFLVGPSGTRVELLRSVGGSGDNFTGTTLDDQATASITEGVAPFSGSFRPTGRLADFIGQSAAGVWTLEVVDGTKGDIGTLSGWSISITYSSEPFRLTGFDGSYVFQNMAPGNYTLAEVLRPDWEQTTPQGGTYWGYDSAADRLFFVNGAGTVTALGAAGGDLPVSGLAYDTTRRMMYGSSNTGQIWTFNLATGAAASIGTLPALIENGLPVSIQSGLTYNPIDHRLYSVTPAGALVQIDPAALSATVVSDPANVPGVGASGISIDPRNGRIYVYSPGLPPNAPPGTLPSPQVYSYDALTFADRRAEYTPFVVSHGGMAFNGTSLVLGAGPAGTQQNLYAYDPGTGRMTPLFPTGALNGLTLDGLEHVAGGSRTVAVASGVVVRDVDFGNRRTLGGIAGTKWNDEDGDGSQGPTEPGLPGWAVYLDADRDGQWDQASATVPSADVLLQIPDLGTIKSNLLTYGLDGVLAEVKVTLNITHNWDEDLRAVLVSPSGTRVVLFNGVGGNGHDFTGTVLEDNPALMPIAAGMAPFTGRFRPEGRLSDLGGENPNGIWTLEVSDKTAGNIGTLVNWSLELTYAEPGARTGSAGEYAFAGLPAGTYSVAEVVRPGWSQTYPDPDHNPATQDAHVVLLGVGEVRQGVDFGNQAQLAEIRGAVFNDLDGDKVRDPGEPGQPNWTVYLDQNGNQQFDETTTIRQSTVSQAIPAPPGFIESPLPVSGIAGRITDVNVTLSITHDWDADLSVFLISPSGTSVELFSNVGYDGDDFVNTTLDDQAAELITLGNAPFTGVFRPEGSLADFIGQDPNGTWKLKVEDGAPGEDDGQLGSWSIALTWEEPNMLTDTDGNYVFARLQPGPYNVGAAERANWDQTYPEPVSGVWTVHEVTLSAGDIAEPVDFGTRSSAIDWGDALDPTYPTLAVNNGASHRIRDGFHLGALVDAETNGQPGAGATGDDLNGAPGVDPDDEDGVEFVTALLPGQTAKVRVTASAAGKLDAWIDFGRDGSWAEPEDQIALNAPLAAGANEIEFDVPSAGSAVGPTFARFRFSSAGGLSYNGPANDGEVEDYQAVVQPRVLEGTPGNDTFTFRTDGVRHFATVNGALHTFDASVISVIRFNGLGGDDQITATGGTDVDTATVGHGYGDLVGPGYQVSFDRIKKIRVLAGLGSGQSAAILDKSRDLTYTGNDRFYAVANVVPQLAISYMSYGDGYDSRVYGFGRVTGSATTQEGTGKTIGHGGQDSAYLYDTAAGEIYTGTLNGAGGLATGTLTFPGVYENSATGFDLTYAFSNAPGSLEDRVILSDGPGKDNFYGTPTEAYFRSADGVLNFAGGFDKAEGQAFAGGDDGAYLYDSAGDDLFTGSAGNGLLAPQVGSVWEVKASGFERIYATARFAGDYDRVLLSDSAGDDRLYSTPTESYIRYQNAALTWAKGFEQVDGQASTGNDWAYFYDSAASAGDDVFTALGSTASMASLSGGSYYNQASGFDRVYAYSSAGNDWADLFDSAGNDRFTAWPEKSQMLYQNGQEFWAYAFDQVSAYAALNTGGDDSATLYDSTGNDTYNGGLDSSSMTGPFGIGTYLNTALGFDRYYAYATKGGVNDVATLTDTQWDDYLYGYGHTNEIYIRYSPASGGSLNYTKGFDLVNARASTAIISDVDRAFLYDSTGNDTFTGSLGKVGQMKNEASSYWFDLLAFDQVTITSSRGGTDKATRPSAVDYLLTRIGPWQDL